MTGKIFISYRRADTEGYAGRIYDRLRTHFSDNEIFMDVDDIEPGEDFVLALQSAVGACDVLIALIGGQWLAVKDAQGDRRLEDPNDFVRLETEERIFFTVFDNTFAQRFKVGVLIPTNGVSIYEKYYLGGQYTLRGYPERAVGPDSLGDERYGNILLNLNLEYRIRLPLNFGLVGFFDAGYIDNEMSLFNSDYLKMTAGFGLRYFTPIGPLRADIGFPLGEKGNELYLGIYHTF